MAQDDPKKPSELAQVIAENYPLVKSWCWDWKFHRNLEHHMHAIGVISANYNDLEFSLFLVFFYFMNDYRSIVPQVLFARLSNQTRIDYLRQFSKSHLSGASQAVTNNFFDGFSICADNRNSLMHASFPDAQNIADAADPATVLHKRSQGNYGSVKRIENVTVITLRRIADEIAMYERLGLDLYAYLTAQRLGGTITLKDRVLRPTLPETLPVPEKLILPDPPNPKGG